MVKNLKLFNVVFDSSKYVSWGAERNKKKHMSLPSTVTKKIQKTLQKGKFSPKMPVFGKFWWVFLILSVKVLGKELWFFVLRSVPQDASFELVKSTLRKKS